MNRLFQKFTLYELVIMAVMAALDIATKQIVELSQAGFI